MSEKELSFEELTGSSSVDEWQQEASDTELSKVSTKAQEQLDLEKEIENLETQLKETKDKHRVVAEVELPEAMQEAMDPRLRLSLSIKDIYRKRIGKMRCLG